MNKMFRGFELVRPCINDMLIITKVGCSNHMERLELTIKKLEDNKLKCNIETKSSFGQTDIEYIGFWMTSTGIQPINKNVEVIVKMTPPYNNKKVRAFVGLVNYYMYMCSRWSHLLHPLT